MPPNNFRITPALMALALAPWALLLGADDLFTPPITVVQANPLQRGTLLAATGRALLFRSLDAGDTWAPLPFPAESRASLHALMMDPARPSVYLVAVSSETPRYAGVFRTMDAGVTWEQLQDLKEKQVWSLAASTADGRVMAAGAQDGVYLTRDGGDSWARISAPWPAGPRPVVALTFDPLDSRTLYAGTPHLAWKTNNGGATWRQIPKGMQADSDVFSIEVDGNRPKRLFAGACSGIYRSLDGGGTWASLERALGGPFRTYVITRKPGRTNVVFAGTSSGLMTSPDGGFTWRKLSAWTARSIAFDPYDPQCMFVATDRGILRSQDGGASFKETNQGLYNRSVTSEIGMRVSVPPGAARTTVVRVKR